MFNTTVDQKDRITQSIVRLLLKDQTAFYGNLSMRLVKVNATKWLPTCATDGKHLYYNEDFLRSLDRFEIDFVISHEIMHCAYQHMDRRSDRNPKIWNWAGDYRINYDLVEAKVGTIPKSLDKRPLYDAKYSDMSSDEIYSELVKNMKSQKDSSGQGSDASGSGKSNQSAASGSKKGTQDGNSGQGGNEKSADSGDLTEQDVGAASDQGSFDEHLEHGEFLDQDGNPIESDPTGENGPIPISKEEAERIADEMEGAVIDAAKAVGSGNCPSGVRRMLHELLEPKIDWRDAIAVSIQSHIKNDYSFMRPSRKGQSAGIILPGMIPGDKIEVHIAIDTSGSMSEPMIRDMLSEVQGIMDQFDEYIIRVWTFDTKVYNCVEFTSENGEQITEYEIHGGGGTSFDVNWDFMKENDMEPSIFLMFTDGYPYGSWGDEDYCETIFLIHGSRSIVAPFGETLYYDDV